MEELLEDPNDEDTVAERAVLQEVLSLHPTHLTTAELVRKVSSKPDNHCEVEALERAIADLVSAGVLRYIDVVIAPTYAVLHANGLN